MCKIAANPPEGRAHAVEEQQVVIPLWSHSTSALKRASRRNAFDLEQMTFLQCLSQGLPHSGLFVGVHIFVSLRIKFCGSNFRVYSIAH